MILQTFETFLFFRQTQVNTVIATLWEEVIPPLSV